MFPGYVFVRLICGNYAQRVAVLGCTGVVGFVGDGQAAWPIPDAEINSVRTIIASRLDCLPYQFLKEGTLVDVVHSLLQGTTGILIQEPRKHRLVVTISLFARAVSVATVEAAGASAA